VFEAEEEERDVMERPPRPPEQPLVSSALIGSAVAQGAAAFPPVLALVALAMARGMPDAEIRALAFVALVFSIVALIFVHRAFGSSLRTGLRRPNRALMVVLMLIAATIVLVLLWPPASALFRFGPLHADDLLLAAGGALLILLGLELAKRFRLRRIAA
jgi:P-type Ca2+ transporter type 2C